MTNETQERILYRMSDGLCRVGTMRLIDGAPVDGYDEPYQRSDESTIIAGWGELDGQADVWTAPSGAFDVLRPRP